MTTDRPILSRAAASRWAACARGARTRRLQRGRPTSTSSQQIGPDPVLPEPRAALLPDLKVAEVVGWQDGQTPTVAEGLTVTRLCHRSRQSAHGPHAAQRRRARRPVARARRASRVSRPKDIIRGWIMSIAHGGGGGPQKESNLITLLRDTNRDGTVDERHDLLTGLALALRRRLDRRHALRRRDRRDPGLSLRARADRDHRRARRC